ncbi:hypothetical protein F4818DRAFT_302826 [Hypoxylon cercidicola]|nr:hypothetical protein F4818DRAFT_302826 [Hypoxylon cercidicola]
MTPLNDVAREDHEFECIAISGLASHPFGSWAPKGQGQDGDRSFMWIRDELPSVMPNTRVSIYGYDTTLIKSNSFQSIQDMAASLIHHIKASGWAMESARPLVFLAHSLGGIVLKEAFSTLANGHDEGMHILRRFRGGIFFGVPSQGMATSHLLAMVQDQANEQIVHDLSTNSEYLRFLDDQFSGLAETRDMRIHWAYETKTSPTVIMKPDKSFAREGPEEVLVSKDSATRSLYASRSSALFPINENHSDIVKFREGDPTFLIIADKLKEACRGGGLQSIDGISAIPGTSNLALRSHGILNMPEQMAEYNTSGNITTRTNEWTIKDLMTSLKVPDENYRIDTIDKNFQHTFEWIFDDEKTSLSRWLKTGEGLFWIHGKPGSGKSTLMKFIFQSPITWELLHKFASEAIQISACFFFHDRGTLLQKSFEGLLRSVLYQIIEKADASKVDLTELLTPLFQTHSRLREHQTKLWTIEELEHCIRLLFRQTRLNLEIVLVLDALDEYDGQPEFICGILDDLMNMTENSCTKLKILFSSRPWEAFKRHFKTTPSVQLQDYTKGDIQEYCWGTIGSQEGGISTSLVAVGEEIIRRADGVFLWVKLVLRELTNEALQGLGPDELTRTLDSIPSDLREYYSRTVQRIPQAFRWDAYVIFVVLLATQRMTLNLAEAAAALECSQKSTYVECCESLTMLKRRMWPNPKRPKTSRLDPTYRYQYPDIPFCVDDLDADTRYVEKIKNKILTSTGGLIELAIPVGAGYVFVLQWAHQTVKEFARSQNFRRSILGGRDWQTQENGHTFLAKYCLADRNWDMAASCLWQHEVTTGRSMKDFIDSIPKTTFRYSADLKQQPWHLDGPLGLAMEGNLRLYVNDSLASDPDIFKKTQERLLSKYPVQGVASSTHTALQRLILENGYTLQKDNGAFAVTMGRCLGDKDMLIRSAGLFMDSFRFIKSRFDSVKHASPSFLIPNLDRTSFFEDKASLLINRGQNPNTPFFIHSKCGDRASFLLLRRNRPHYLKALHLAKTVTLSRCLLEHGANVNALDTAGNTPLDHLLNHCLSLRHTSPGRSNRLVQWQSHVYQTAVLLIEHGGVTSTSTGEVWEYCISWFETGQLDVAPLRECFGRLQFDERGNPKRKRK